MLEEAEFYNIASLVRLVKERIRDNENRTSQVMDFEFLRGNYLTWLSVRPWAWVWVGKGDLPSAPEVCVENCPSARQAACTPPDVCRPKKTEEKE